MRDEMNSYRFEILNRRENKFCSHEVLFHFGYISKQLNVLMDMCRHFISDSLYMIFYHKKLNFISVKMTDMKSIPALSFKRTCALNATSTTTLRFISFRLNYVHIKISCRFELSFRSK